MDAEHVAAVCTGLGSLREDASGRDVYVKHADCLVNLKHLQRFLRRDDPTQRDIFMQLGKWNTIRQDLLPIVIHYRDDFDLVLNAVKVMVFLTMPVDSSSVDIPQQLEYLRRFKAAVLEDDAIGVIVSHLQDPLEHMESGTLTDMDGKMFQLVLTLIRNLLAVDDPSSPLVRASVANAQALYIKDALIERLFNENAMDLLLALTQHVGGEQPFLRQDNLLILEIFHYLLSGQTPDVIASSRHEVQKQPKSQPSGAALEALMAKEREERRNRSFASPRHSNFCGMFVRVGKDGSKTIITRNPYQSPLDSLFQKPEIKRGLVKRVATDLPLHVPSSSTVCAMLRGFADQLLEGNYNLLMQTIKSDIRGERSNVQSQDIVMYFSVANFFTAYQRCLLTQRKPNDDAQQSGENQSPTENSGAVFQGRCGRIASTMDEDMFILVTMKWQAFVEAAKETSDWFPATSSGVLLKEMIHMLDYILKVSNPNTNEGQQEIRVARILLYKVFYDHTENGILPFILRLMKNFDIHKQPRSQLAGLVETTHIVLRLLDSITKQDGALRVKKKARSTKKKNSKPNETSQASGPAGKDQDQTREEANLVASGEAQVGSEDSNANALIYNALHATHANTNLGPIDDVEVAAAEGHDNDIEERDNEVAAAEGHDNDIEEHDNDEFKGKGDNEEEEGESESESESEEEEEEKMETKEETLDVMKCVRMFADNTILHNYCWLLKNYFHNTPAINYYIVRMLQRICEDLMMEPMLYQLSILQTCYEILSNDSIRNSEQHQFVISFLTKLVRHLFEKLKASPLLFVDLLFWKSKQDCHCITASYSLHGLKKFSGGRKSISKEAYVQDRRTLLNSLGDDDDDVRNDANMPNVHTLLRSMDSNEEKGKVTRQKAVKKKGPFTDFEEDLIKDLFTRFQENRSCTKLIAEGLEEAGAVQESGERFTSAQVGRALKRLDLARVVGKKATQNKSPRNPSDSENESDVGENNDPDSGPDEDMSEGEQVAGPSRRKGLLESLNEDSHDEGDKQVGVIENGVAAGESLPLKAAVKKRKSGVSKVQGGNDVSKRRRRSGLFSEEQDHKLQSLFEKYKGMTRFKHLIVNDLEGVFTTAQIGRRLQQLGCVEPRKRKSKLAKMSEDEDEVEQSTPGSGDEHISEKQDDVGHNSDDSKEDEDTDLPTRSGFKASWGPSARKCAQMSKSTAVVEDETHHEHPSDDDVPIALHHSMRSIFQKRKSLPDNGAELQMRDGGDGAGSEAAGDKCDLQKQIVQGFLEDQLQATNSIAEINYLDHQSTEDSVAELVPKTFQRRRLQHGNQSMQPIESDIEKSADSDSGDDAEIVIAKKTSERKRRPSMEQNIKSSTSGDSETDPSDVEDTQDLATALQEVRIYENQLATMAKKRRLERKQTLSNGEVDDADEELMINSHQQGDSSNDPTVEAPFTHRKGARKVLVDAMASDEDE